MTLPNKLMSTEELAREITTEIQAERDYIGSLLGSIKLLLIGIIILGIVALNHFW